LNSWMRAQPIRNLNVNGSDIVAVWFTYMLIDNVKSYLSLIVIRYHTRN
jgi:hypothetical protein